MFYQGSLNNRDLILQITQNNLMFNTSYIPESNGQKIFTGIFNRLRLLCNLI